MPRALGLAGAAVAGCLGWSASNVHADDMDISLARLRIPTGGEFAPDPLPAGCEAMDARGGRRSFCPDDEAWARLMAELGFASAPPVLTGARTAGYGGFRVAIEGWVTGIDSGSRHWRLGTEGDPNAGSESDRGSPGINRFPSSALVWTRTSIRKGFPLGFELGTSLGHLLDTSLWSWGLEVKWSPFEGFRRGIGVIPDLAVRGMVQTVTGDPEFNLTVPSFDVTLSKPFTVMGVGRITPILALQWAFIFADSELVDLTPDVDAWDECRPEPGTSGTCTRDPRTDPLPDGRVPGEDYNNNAVFAQVRHTRTRLVLGVEGEYRALRLAGTFAFDVVPPEDADADAPRDLPRQWSVAASIGLGF
ncbi:MAG: hypothetical protein NZ898_06115 [Myxococcota bacterium]|nr:hypothetical protein [Myxococcota bacterium]MDW8362187.1 hypothetical protein [Myxococcales bacterium]